MNHEKDIDFPEQAASRLFSIFNEKCMEMAEQGADFQRWAEYVRSLGVKHITPYEITEHPFVIHDPVILRALVNTAPLTETSISFSSESGVVISYIGMDEETAMKILAVGLP